MSLSSEIILLAETIAEKIKLPAVSGLYLPPLIQDPDKQDEFAFVFLDDGSAGPFYVSLDDSLAELWQRYPASQITERDPTSLIRQLDGGSLAERALAIGAFNALSQHVLRSTHYFPQHLEAARSIGAGNPQPGDRVGMVGYFCPLVEQLVAQGIEVLVLEKKPERVEIQQGVSLTTNVKDLDQCQYILCTASTLINDTLQSILDMKAESAIFSVIGPSGSGLPDVLFQHGVDAVGGVYFHDAAALHDALGNHESWGCAGMKYQFTRDNYPGITALLER